MQSRSITLSTVPSDLQRLLDTALVMVGLALVGVFLTPWLALVAFAILMGWLAIRPPPSSMRVVISAQEVASARSQGQPETGRWQARRVLEDGRLGEPEPLVCTYLGPWLIGLRVGKTAVWLWPDSAPAAQLRLLRRELGAVRL